MITQQEFDKLNLRIEKALSATSMIEGHQGQTLRDSVLQIKDKSLGLEALWRDGQQPGQPTPQVSETDQHKTKPPVLVIHNMEFWQMGDLLSGYGLSKGFFVKPEGNYTMGVDTFEVSLNRIEDTVLCITLSTKLQLSVQFSKTINSEAIWNRVFTLWSNLMVVEDIGQRTKGQEAFTQFVSQVTDKISRPLQATVDGVDLFILNQPAHT